MRHARWKLAAALAICLLAPAVAQAKTTLVEVESASPAMINRLEALGLDVTYEGSDRTEVMLHGAEDKQILAATGYRTKVLMEDMAGANDAQLAKEAAAQKRVRKGIAPLSTLPTGRVAYRTYADIQTEIQQIAAANPDRVKLITLPNNSLLGKPILGLEVTHNVAQNAGKPAFLLTGVHHAREWPTAEFTLEFVHDLLMHDGTDPDATSLLEKGKLIAVPLVNPDGYDLSRNLQNEQKRKNCRMAPGVIPTLADCTGQGSTNRGVDNNRNYLPFWGGPGSSTSQTASNSRGEAPLSEPENKNLHSLQGTNQITVAINNHTPDQRLLRAPSSSNEPQIVADHAAYDGLLRRLATNLQGWPAGPWTDVYYEASSTAEQEAYYTYGTFGFTPEATPGFSGAATFHPPYQNVIDNYLGVGTRYAGATMRGLYYDAFKAATEPALHSVITGTAPAGATLALTKAFSLDTSLTTWVTGQPQERRAFPVSNRYTLTVPANGRFEWHVNPSLRPSQYSSAFVDEAYVLTCTAADGTVLETTTVKIGRGELANRSLCTQGNVGGSVPATLSLTLGVPAAFGAFTPGINRDYDSSMTANVVSTAGDAALSVADADATLTGRLVNGAFSLPQPLRAAATSPAGTGAAFAAVGGSASPTALLTWPGPVSNDPVTLAFKQAIGAGDALRTGTYSKTLTFTLSTTNP